MIFDEEHKVANPRKGLQVSQSKSGILGQSEWDKLYASAKGARVEHWKSLAIEQLHWTTRFHTTLNWTPPKAEWFVGGELNVSAQCLDQNIFKGHADKTALIWRGEPLSEHGIEERRTFTYRQLLEEVKCFCSALKALDLVAGDRVVIYLPLIPEATVAMLACARLGLVHSVVFGGFSAESLKERCINSGAKALVTATYGWRRGKKVELETAANSIRDQVESLEGFVVVDRETWNLKVSQRKANLGAVWNSVELPTKNTSVKSSEQTASHSTLQESDGPDPQSFASEHPLFLLYTSGTTGKPKGLLHTSAGYILWAKTSFQWIFNTQAQDVFWCTADVGWITGHSYVTYGPLANGATVFLYEGAPDFPDFGRFWNMIEQEKISILYTAPTAIRSFMKQGDHFVKKADLRSLRLLGSVGEPINPEAWKWYFDVVGGGRCPIVDTWWQTETGGVVMTPLPCQNHFKPGCATQALPGFQVEVVNASGEPVPKGDQGQLVIQSTWPSQARTVYGDDLRYKDTYWSQYHEPSNPNLPWYFTGDGAYRDKDGHIWIIGRVDDVLNVAGHRIGTMEIESALGEHPLVAESAVVGVPSEVKGTSICAFVLPKNSARDFLADPANREVFCNELRNLAAKEIGSFAKPEHVRILDSLPKTRSGKIMRRLLRDVASGRGLTGDTSTLEDLSALSSLQKYQED